MSKLGLWYIEVENNGKILRFNKTVAKNDLNEAIAKTVIYFYKELKIKENEKS